MFRSLFKYATMAGLIGLAVLHADDVASISSKALASFRGAVNLA